MARRALLLVLVVATASALGVAARLRLEAPTLAHAAKDRLTPSATLAPMPLFTLSPSHQSVPLATGSASVDVRIQDATNVSAIQFLLRYDPAILKQPTVQPGPFLAATGRPVYCLTPVIDGAADGPGTLLFGCATLGVGEGASGSGVLATVTFAFTGAGGTSIAFDRLALADSLGYPLCPCAGQDGSIDVTVPTPTPTPTSTPTPRPACIADVNGDGTVNIRDLVLVARHMGSRAGDRRYDARYDLNRDGRINVLDLMIVLRSLGQHC